MPVSSICAIASRGASAAPSMPPVTPSIAAVRRKPRLPSFTSSVIAFSSRCWGGLDSPSRNVRRGHVNSGSLRARPARGDRPQRLDPAIAYADIPIVQIHGRVAMAGNEHHLVAQMQRLRVATDDDLAMLVGNTGQLEPRPAVYPRRPLLGAVGFEPRIDDRAIRRRRAHDGGEHEQAVLEFPVRAAV